MLILSLFETYHFALCVMLWSGPRVVPLTLNILLNPHLQVPWMKARMRRKLEEQLHGSKIDYDEMMASGEMSQAELDAKNDPYGMQLFDCQH